MAFTFTTVGKIVTGWGSAAELGVLAARLGKRALLVTGRSALRSAGITERLIGILSAADVSAAVFEKVEPEPSVATVDAARAAFLGESCDLVIAVGGGSAIDVGKAVAALAGPDAAPTAFYFTDRPMPPKAAPCIAVPTTSGTGAEVTPNSVLNDNFRKCKQSIRGPSLLPEVALVDAELTVGCPPDVTAASGMDALTQAIEAYWSLGASPLTEALALHSAELAWKNIMAAYQDGRDRPAREAMAYASLLAGMALANARLGAVHGMAHPIGYRYHARHGAICAALLPHVMRFNRSAVHAKYEILSGLFGADAARAVQYLLVRLNLPARLSVLGLKAKDFDAIAAESLPSGSMKANPRQVTAEDVKGLLAEVL